MGRVPMLLMLALAGCDSNDGGDDEGFDPPEYRTTTVGSGEACGAGINGFDAVLCNGSLQCHPIFGVCESQTAMNRRCCDCMWDRCGSDDAYSSMNACADKLTGDRQIVFNRRLCAGEDIGISVCVEPCYMFGQR